MYLFNLTMLCWESCNQRPYLSDLNKTLEYPKESEERSLSESYPRVLKMDYTIDWWKVEGSGCDGW